MPSPFDARVPVNAADGAYGKVASPGSLWRPHPWGRNQGVPLTGRVNGRTKHDQPMSGRTAVDREYSIT
jgi:hypothetical protein